jgi:hypothetical protein
MLEVGNINIGGLFVHNGGLFVCLPFDWEDEKYYNLCIATRNRDDYETGEKYFFDNNLMVFTVGTSQLKTFIPN